SSTIRILHRFNHNVDTSNSLVEVDKTIGLTGEEHVRKHGDKTQPPWFLLIFFI
ncbi:hypothetical protein UPYG_G00051120, partial [Umbra pygmaea]